jgi:ABC-type thiamine transport system ATPase subunit
MTRDVHPVADHSGVSSPQVPFLDEPTVGLDPRIRVELLDVIARLRERSDMTFVLTTHYLEEAQRLCGKGLHDIWGMGNVTLEAWLSLAVVAAFAAAITAVSIRAFSRSAVS